MITSLMLGDDGDLLCAEYEGEVQTVVIGAGAEIVSQTASQAVSLNQGRVWWNLQAGIDFEGLFRNAPFGEDQMELMRASTLREAVLSVPGVAGFAEDGPVTFEYDAGLIKTNMPCIEIDCENSRFRGYVEPIN